MGAYVIRRVLLNLVVLWVIATFVFIAVRVLPGDYAAQQVSLRQFAGGAVPGESPQKALEDARKALGLNDSIPEQYGRYLGNILTGDFDRSFATRKSTMYETGKALPYTI